MSNNTTIIICAAGMGTRLGIGTTKALVNVAGKSLIQYQLEQLDDYDDVRIVVGFQAESIIDAVNEYRKDIMFAFNNEFKTTGPLASVGKAITGAKEYVVVLGGDMLIHPDDFTRFLKFAGSCIGYSKMHSKEPVYVDINDKGKAIAFSKGNEGYEWSGLVKFRRDCFKDGFFYVHQMVENLFPMDAIETRGIDIDTVDDYEKLVEWVNSEYSDEYLF